MAKALLHQLRRQLEAAIRPTVDAPGRVEVSEGVKAGVFRALDRLAIRSSFVDRDAGGDHRRHDAAFDDVLVVFDQAAG